MKITFFIIKEFYVKKIEVFIHCTSLKNSSTGETVYTPPQDINEINKLMGNLEEFINNQSINVRL